jgi:hypothetical protein
LQAFVESISAEYHIQYPNMAVIAHSVGAVLAAVWVHDYAVQRFVSGCTSHLRFCFYAYSECSCRRPQSRVM